MNSALKCTKDRTMVAIKCGWEIRNVHTSDRHPDTVYSELYFDGELELSATLKMCYERILDNHGRKYKDPVDEEIRQALKRSYGRDPSPGNNNPAPFSSLERDLIGMK